MVTPLVLVPGMMCDARMWGDIPDRLCGGSVVHALPTGFDSVQAIAADILGRAPQAFALAGLSMGGIVAMEIVRQAPLRVKRLALLDTNPLADAPAVQARRAVQINRAESGDLATVMIDEMIPNYWPRGMSDAAISRLCLDMALSLGPRTFAHQSRALRDRPDQTRTLAGFKGPTLILMGEHDRLCPRDRHELMHSLMPQSELAVISGAGHLPCLDQPEQTALEFQRWLNKPV
jgi:pimeloyl-ACP methyl ester carboxylesterase